MPDSTEKCPTLHEEKLTGNPFVLLYQSLYDFLVGHIRKINSSKNKFEVLSLFVYLGHASLGYMDTLSR